MTAFLLFPAATALGSRMSDALRSAEQGVQYLNFSAVPAWQYAAEVKESTGNYNLDAIATITFARWDSTWLDHSSLIIWVNSADTLGGLDSAPELARKAGLLWDTNDISAASATTSLLVLGVEQWFLDNSLSIGLGQYFPGQYFLLSSYTADNSNTFTNKMIAGNPAASFWNSIGLGINAAWYMDEWAIAGGVVDAQASADGLDFSSFAEGKYAYMLEVTWEPRRSSGVTSLSVLAYRVDAHRDIDAEHGLAMQFTHEYGRDAEYAVFGRYTIRNGGGSESTPDATAPVDYGGFLGLAWNRPFGRQNQQLAASLIYGKPTGYQASLGFNTQYGLEAYWKYQPAAWFHVTGSVQFIRNRDDRFETVVGLRANFALNRSL